jgi:hypothetical protein
MEVEKPVYDFEGIEFCQTHPVFDGARWRMVRNHTAVLNKDPLILVDIPNANVHQRWMNGVGKCGLAIANGLPVQQELYSLFVRESAGKTCKDSFLLYIMKNTSRMIQSKNLAPRTTPVSISARVSYYAAFGILPDRQIAIEEHYKNFHLLRLDVTPISHAQVGTVRAGHSIPSFEH